MTQANGKQNLIRGRQRTISIPDLGILFDWGITVPPDGTAGYAPSCIFQDVDAAEDSQLYVNAGSNTSSDFNAIDTGALTAAGIDVVDTAAWFTGTNVETVLAEIGELLLANSTAADDGPSPLIWSGAPILDAILNPAAGYYFFSHLDEGDYTSGAGLWTLTQRSSGSMANNAAEQGGVMTIDAGAATAGQGVTCQMHSIGVLPAAGRTIRFECRLKIDEDAGRIAFGLGAVGTTDWVSDDSIATNADCAMFFRDGGTGATDWSLQISDGSTAQAVDDAFTASDTGYETFGFVIVGDGASGTDSITWYRNGATVAFTTDVSDLPDAIMVPTYDVNADGTDQPVMNIDWIQILVTD